MGEENDKPTTLGHAGAKPSVNTDDLEPGTQVGRYVIESLRSRGGFASVYKARHDTLGRISAIKVLHHALAASSNVIKRFEQEAQAVNRIRHRNIVDIFEIGDLLDGRPYIVMEWLEGRDLEEELQQQGPLPIERVVAIFEELGAALTAAHRSGIIHRDLKASNIVLVGADREVKLVDFGIAKIIDSELGPGNDFSSSGMRVGTPWSMAPEQIRGGPIDARTDVYALGVLIFQLVTGKLPFRAPTPVEVQSMHLSATPPLASDHAAVPTAIDSIIARAMRKNPNERYQSVEAMVQELRHAAANEPIATGPRTSLAFGIHVEARIAPGAAGDDAFDDVERVMAEVYAAAEHEGLLVVLETSNAIVLASLLPSDPITAREQRRQLLDTTLDLGRRLDLRLDKHSAVDIAIATHVDLVTSERGDDGLRITSGELLRLATWTGRRPHGVFATRAVLADLERDFTIEEIDEVSLRVLPRA